MIVKFKNLKLFNFMSFETASIDLENNGFVQIIGINNNSVDNSKSNGSGKSAIWEAFNWCLTGETLRGSKDVVRNGSDDGTLVSLSFSIDNDDFEITRTKNHSKYKTNLFIEKNGTDISGKGIRDTESILENVLPELSSSLINSIIILGQGLPMRFTNNTPSGRKEVLEKLSKSDFMIEDLKNRIADRKNELYARNTNVEKKLIEIEVEKKSESNQLQTLTKEYNELSSADKQSKLTEKTQCEKRSNEIENLIFDLTHKYQKSIQEEYDFIQKEKNDFYSGGIKKTDELKEKQSLEIEPLKTEYANILAEITFLKKEIIRLDNISDVCPTCGQKLPDVHKIDTSDLKKKLEIKNKEQSEKLIEIESLQDLHKKQIKEAKSKLEEHINLYDDKLSVLFNEKQQLADLLIEKNQLESKIEIIDNWLKTYKTNLSSLTDKINVVKNNLTELNYKEIEVTELKNDYENRLTIQNKFETVIKRDFRGILLQNCINYINKKAKEYSKKIFNTDLIEFKLDGNNISISYCGKEYESMSGGEKQKIDLIIQFAIRSMLCTYLNFSCNLLILDELTDNIDSAGCKLVIDFIAEEASDVDSVYIISHHSNLQLPYDKELTIVKNEQGISSVL